MKNLFVIILTLLCSQSKAQKPALTDTSYKVWTAVDQGKLSADGKFASYQIENEPLGKNTLVVTATNEKWQMRFVDAKNLNFTSYNNYAFFIKNS